MNAQEEPNLEGRDEPGAGAAEYGGVEPSAPTESRGDEAANPADRPESPDGAPKVEAPRLQLVPYFPPPRAKAPDEAKLGARWPGRWTIGIAASLALVAAGAAAALYDHASQSNLLAAKAEESQNLAQTVKSLKDRIDAIEAARTRDEFADLRKLAAEMKAETGATRDLGGALAQLTARVDRVDHDQSGRLDKLADRIDHESTTRIADLATRIDKLEKKPAAPVVATAPATPSPRQAAVPAKPDPGVSNETTGSIERPRTTLRGYSLVEVQDGFAVVDGRNGPQQVAPGDFLPGAGRVQRIERRGQQWVVVTSSGIIVGDQEAY